MASRKKQRKRMRRALAEAYQVACLLGAGEKVLDNLAAAARGRKPPHDDALEETRLIRGQRVCLEAELAAAGREVAALRAMAARAAERGELLRTLVQKTRA